MFINGTWTKALGPIFRTISPVDGSTLYSNNEADLKQVETAAKSAKDAFDTWSELPFNERMDCLLAFKNHLIQSQEEFADLISKETGKPLWETRQEVKTMIEKVTISESAYRQRCRVAKNGQVVTRYKPHGALAVLGPFNFPGHLPNGHIIPALIAGNTIVYKPSEKTPETGEMYAKIMEKSGFPKGVFNMVQGGKDVGEALAKSSYLDGVLFTGSHKAGTAISKILADHPGKILALEMGGNNPLIIEEIPDLDFACFIAIQSAFLTAGQRCSCARRLILKKGAFAEKFLSELVERTKKLKIGAPQDTPEPYMGPLISQSALNSYLEAQESLIKLGGKPLLASKKLSEKGAFVSPGIIDMTGIQSPDAEIFGPLLQVYLVNSYQEALEEASRTQFGLTAGLVSKSRHSFELFQKKIKAGVINWNAPTTGASSKSAFGGMKESGNHRASAFFAADYCSSPIACMEIESFTLPDKLPPGMN